MASSTSLQDSATRSAPDITLEEIIFSCEICQATVSEIYATKDQHQGFHSGSSENNGNGVAAKLWIGACSHVFCGKHLEGGGVAFHPKDVAPKAGCPVCPKELESSREQDLYPIRGLNPGEYDEIIPESWLRCPPTRLDAQDGEMDALRFQYQRLASYSRKVHKAWKIADNKRRIMESTLSSERKRWRKREAEVEEALREKDALIGDQDAKLRKWDGRKDAINHYMSIVGPMAKDIADMRALLEELGYNVPNRDYSYQPKPAAKPHVGEDGTMRDRRHDSSATLVGSSAQTSSASRKRKAENNAYANSQEQGLEKQRPHPESVRSMTMMPPPLPKARPPRKPDASARRAVPQLRSQQVSLSGESGIQSRHQVADLRNYDRGTRAPHQTRANNAQHIIPQSHERSSRHEHRTALNDELEPLYSGEQQSSPSLPAVQLYGNSGWQNMPPPSTNLGIRQNHPFSNRTEQTQPLYKQQRLPHRESQPLGSGRPVLSTGFNQLPARVPLTQAIHRNQGELLPRSHPPIYKPGEWRGATPRGRMDIDSELPSSRIQPVQPHLNVPLYQQPRRPNVGHNGTSTLSSEFRAQELSTNLQRPVQQPSLPSVPRTARYSEDRPHAASDMSYYDPVYGPLAQQSGEDAPREMKGFQMPPSSAVRAPLDDHGRYRLTTPANRKHLEPPAASSVVSPFFGQKFQRQPAAVLQDIQEPFSYAAPPASARGGVVERYKSSERMLPPPTTHRGLDHSMQSREANLSQSGGASSFDNHHSQPMAYSNGPQRTSLATTSRPPQSSAPRGRVSLPANVRPSQRNAGRREVAIGAGAPDFRSIFSGAAPARRSVRR